MDGGPDRHLDRANMGIEDDVTLRPVAFVRGGRQEPTDDRWASETCRIELVSPFDRQALAGLDGFSHLDVVFVFHLVDEDSVVTDTRRPRGRADWPEVGIFAQRGRVRPNRIGVSTCEIESVVNDVIVVRGLDAVDGTPVLDIKPHMSGFHPRSPITEPSWAVEIMSEYW
jgi:tRNA-Thr(GGU) m(6)t(6)A37 methyltransferase TsaA